MCVIRTDLGMGAPMSTDAVLRDMPRPDRVTTPAQFVAALQALRSWAKLTYGELENNAQAYGDRLPRSTIASALSRGRIPREQTIAAFVRACGCDEKTVQHWLVVRRKIASADRAVGDLAGAVETWVSTKWRVRGKEPARVDRRPAAGKSASASPASANPTSGGPTSASPTSGGPASASGELTSAEVASADLASEVETWLAGRGRIPAQRSRQRRVDELAAARQRWAEEAAARSAQPFDEPLPEPTFGTGRLAEAVERSTSNKWVGLHRRPSRRRIFFRG